MSINPFKVQGGVVPRGTKPIEIDPSSMMLYNILMNRYYEVGRDCKNGLISKEQATFQLKDVESQLKTLRMGRLEPSIRKNVEGLLDKVQKLVAHIDDIRTIILLKAYFFVS